MAKCFSFTAAMDWFLRYSFWKAGLKSTTTDLGDGTIMHCWVPQSHVESKPTLLLIHGFGSSATWQWNDIVAALALRFNLYVPDLLFFGDSYTTRPDRSIEFQARCVVALMESQGIRRAIHVAGISYGGFVAYCMAAQFKERVGRVVLCCAGVCMEEKDMKEGMFQVKSVEEAVSLLLPQSPQKMKDLLRITFYKPVKVLPSCFVNDFIQEMCTEHLQEKKELIYALHKDRKLSDIPKITQPTLLIWGEHDQIFPLELAHRLKRHVGENAELVILKNAGHAINKEKPKEMYKHFNSFLIDSLPQPPLKQDNQINGCKTENY